MSADTTDDVAFSLWSDDPAPTDLLSFDAVASTVADALLDEALDPVALGLSGPWGSGKTTVLGLVEGELAARADQGKKVLVIKTDPWRYDPSTGAKESLIGEVLSALALEVAGSSTKTEDGKKLLASLAKRVDWAKAIKLAAKTGLALQIPSVDDIVDLVRPKEADAEGPRGLDAFRGEFRKLMESEDLAHLSAVAVLVDDLDRCLPETIIESLEAIRLFLAVPKMSFVIAADEDRVADAIATRFPAASQSTDAEAEEPAKLYLHKIVQTTIPLPALSRFDTQAYLLLLQLQPTWDQTQLETVIGQCADVRRAGGGLDDLTGITGLDMADALAFASRLTPLLYEKLQGNPRRIKRFLNDLNVRQAIARRRGIELDPAVVAKLMVLEVLLDDEFKKVLGWLATGVMRDQLAQLETAAGRPQPAAGPAPEPVKAETRTAKAGAAKAAPDSPDQTAKPPEFSEALLRWAKLPPALQQIDLSPYLYLAASFSGVPLLDSSLPEQLRDIAANLLSSSRADQKAVSNEDLGTLSATEAEALLLHLGRTVRDQPNRQKTGITAILRISRKLPESVAVAKKALLMLPPDEIAFGTPLLFAAEDDSEVRAVLTDWQGAVTDAQVLKAIANALAQS